MISVLASGTLIGAPTERTSEAGNKFVTAQMKTADGDETNLISLVAFDEAICKSLLALSKGDTLVVSGSAKPTSWTGRDGSQSLGLNVVVKVAMTQYAVTKKRKAAVDMADYGLPAKSPLQDTDSDGALF
jgi:single-stranded DNA-binding protein